MPDWDAKYAAAPEGLFGAEPNEYLRAVAARSDFAARSALCLADGDGRNSRWLARLGLRVTALDISPVATRHARDMDAALGVDVERTVADLRYWRPAEGHAWEAVFILYLQGPADLRHAGLTLGREALAAGGWLVLEGFAHAQAGSDLGPPSGAHRYDAAEIPELLPGLELVELLTGRVRLDEGPRHRGLADVVRITARKP